MQSIPHLLLLRVALERRSESLAHRPLFSPKSHETGIRLQKLSGQGVCDLEVWLQALGVQDFQRSGFWVCRSLGVQGFKGLGV